MTDIDNQTLRESVAKSETGNALHDELDKLAREIAQQFSGQAQGPTYRVARLALEAGEQRGMKHQRERDAVIAENYPSPLDDLPMALAIRSIAQAIRSAL